MDGGNGWASAPDFQVHVPTFGERFRGKECPLSKAVGLKGISTQPALDYDVLGGANWDFRTGGGSRTLRRVTQVVEWIPGHGSETETTQDRLRQTDNEKIAMRRLMRLSLVDDDLSLPRTNNDIKESMTQKKRFTTSSTFLARLRSSVRKAVMSTTLTCWVSCHW